MFRSCRFPYIKLSFVLWRRDPKGYFFAGAPSNANDNFVAPYFDGFYQNEDGTFPEVAVTYYARVPRLSTAQTTNWLLGAEPELYLYAALLKSAPYTVDDERLPIWASLYTDALNRLNISSKVALVSGGPLVRGRRGFG